MSKPYLEMTHNELHTRLVRRGLPPKVVEEIKERIERRKGFERSEQANDTQMRVLWANLLRPLRYEINNCKSGLYWDVPDIARMQARKAAMTAYLEVMQELLRRLDVAAKIKDKTPSQIARASKRDIYNDGVHWSDWVPNHIKGKVYVLFDAIPHEKGSTAKRKVPFKRTIPPPRKPTKARPAVPSTDAQRATYEMSLIRRQQSAILLVSIAQKGVDRLVAAGLSNNLDKLTDDLEKALAYSDRVGRAILALESLPRNAVLPANWRELVQD